MVADLSRTATEQLIGRVNDAAMTQAIELVNNIYAKAKNRADFFRLVVKKIGKIRMYKSLFVPRIEEKSMHNAKRARYN